MNYNAYLPGFYIISSKLYTTIPTGNTILVKNLDKYWFQFWKPDIIEQAEYKTILSYEGSEVKYLNVGETIYSNFPIQRIGI